MAAYLKWFGTTILAIVALVIGMVPFIDSWPRWVFVAVGVIALIASVMTFPWGIGGSSSDAGQSKRIRIRQTQKGGDNSTQTQVGGNFKNKGKQGNSN
ncbi:hypothetical protein AB0H71_30020 [Nocardia sp. NPDC050697]|uniref:hypothetical protein n=1 Tax=Nocardia sp. NPDC050697 TaxID=3155158 RepID=UPI0033FF1EA1